jgi:hypothetical protein
METELESLKRRNKELELENYRLTVQLFDMSQSVKDNMIMLEANGRMSDEQAAMDNTMQVIFNLLNLNRRTSFKRDRWNGPVSR